MVAKPICDLSIIAIAIICHAMTETIGFILNDTARLYRRAFNARVRDSGITALQWRLITYLKRHEGIRQGPLAELIEVEPITLSRMVDRLVEAGLVERRADPADRRAWRLYLTTRAADLLGGIRSVVEALNDEALEGLSPAERDQLLDLVARVRANLSRRVCAKEAEPV
jgi:DNA-binding MarR family transcriptional regulator